MATPRKPVSTHKVRCQICSHPERSRIEALRVAGASADVLVEKFGLGGRDAIYRHMEKHVSADVKAAIIADVPIKELAERAVNESQSLLDYLSLVRKVVIEQLLGAASINDRSGTAKLAGRAVEILEALGRLTGELMASPSIVNITNNNFAAIFASPAFIEVERMLAERLARYPDALKAVLTGLDDLDSAARTQGQPQTAPPMLEGSLAA